MRPARSAQHAARTAAACEAAVVPASKEGPSAPPSPKASKGGGQATHVERPRVLACGVSSHSRAAIQTRSEMNFIWSMPASSARRFVRIEARFQKNRPTSWPRESPRLYSSSVRRPQTQSAASSSDRAEKSTVFVRRAMEKQYQAGVSMTALCRSMFSAYAPRCSEQGHCFCSVQGLVGTGDDAEVDVADVVDGDDRLLRVAVLPLLAVEQLLAVGRELQPVVAEAKRVSAQLKSREPDE